MKLDPARPATQGAEVIPAMIGKVLSALLVAAAGIAARLVHGWEEDGVW